MVPTRAVNVPVFEFFCSSIAHFHDSHIKMKILSSKWMIAVYRYIVPVYLCDYDCLNRAVVRMRVKLHSNF